MRTHEPAGGPFRKEAEIDLSETKPQADAGAALRLALKRLTPLMSNLSVQADIAASFGLMVRMRGAALVELLEEMLTVVVHAAPVSRILLTAAADGANISISMSDDIPNADQDLRRASVRGLTRRVAMGGGALAVDVRPGEGTTMTLRLSSVCEDREDRASLGSVNGAMLSFSPSIKA
jgi:signal transduction histidine kinase